MAYALGTVVKQVVPTIQGEVLDVRYEAARVTSAAQAESFTLTDSSAGSVAQVGAQDETLALADTSIGVSGLTAEQAEALALTEASSAALATAVSSADSLGLAETCDAIVTKFAAQTESITISDAWDATLVQLGTLSPGFRRVTRGGFSRIVNRPAIGRRISRPAR